MSLRMQRESPCSAGVLQKLTVLALELGKACLFYWLVSYMPLADLGSLAC